MSENSLLSTIEIHCAMYFTIVHYYILCLGKQFKTAVVPLRAPLAVKKIKKPKHVHMVKEKNIFS